ncbi:uncharacterized protein [Montipora capricornis]|uniref:uncharacterized protein n=1 Tax=Montipora capricornis TaxID=246305 RepID=UPI0035F187A6
MEEGKIQEDLYNNRGDEALHEMKRLLHPIGTIYEHFRVGRETRNPNKCTRLAWFGFKVFFCLFGLWGHQAWNYILRVVFIVTCLYQAVFLLVSKNFPLCAVNKTEQTVPQDADSEASLIFTCVTCAAAVISYVVFVGSFIAAKRKDSALVSPSQSMVDVYITDVYLLFIVAFFMCTVSISVMLYSPLILINTSFMASGVVTIILAHLASVSTCLIFAINCLALGTFAQDTFRLIQNIQNGPLDDIIRIHEDLCKVVFNTVSAYSVWFVLHWFTYGASVLFGAICIYQQASAGCLTYHATVNIFLIYLFLLPCIYAAKITSHCAEICEKINCTTSADWNEGHPFRDRRNISMFISYAKDRRCGFKVGKITFITSLAWFSFFFGLITLMFHFF